MPQTKKSTTSAMRDVTRPEDVGAMGQHYLALLAKSAGLVANASHDDKAGWDLELEPASPTTIDYGSHSKPIYRIQVKSTRGTSRSVAMSFSSLVSLIRFPGPSFLFFLRFERSGGTVPIEARLLHLDRSVARDVLTKMRRKEVAEGAGFKINKASTTINFAAAPGVDIRDGANLRALLAAATGRSYLDYVNDRTKWLLELENENRAMRFSVVFENQEAVEAMARSLLGYDTPVSVDAVRYHAPMGIAAEPPKHSGVFRHTQIKPTEESVRKATVRLRAREHGATYSFPAKVFSTGAILPRKFSAVRVHAEMFNITIKEDPLDVRVDFVEVDDRDLLVPVRDLRNFVAFIDEASHTDVIRTFLEIEVVGEGPPLRLAPETSVAAFDGHHAMRLALDALYAKLDGIGLGDARIRPSDYFTVPGNISFVQHLGTSYSPPASFEFSAPEATKSDANVVVFRAQVELEAVTVHFYGAFFGTVDLRRGGEAFGTFTHSQYLGEVVVQKGSDPSDALKAYGDKMESLLDSRGFRVL